MLSIRGRFITFLLRNRNLLRFPKRRETIDWNTYEAVEGFRKEVEEGAGRFGKLPEGIQVSSANIENPYAEWILPVEGEKDKIILYFHGGGYISGTCKAHRDITAKFVKESNVGALLFQYRLAPEHPFPAALDDAITAYQWLLDQGFLSSSIVFMGDSAGGGLCLATLLVLRDRGISLPAAVVALSPWTDLKCTGESYVTKEKVCLSPEGTGLAFAKHYGGDHDLTLPYISPLYGELHGLPPMLIFAGGEETMRDDSIEFVKKAKEAGVDATLIIGAGLFHCYPATAPLFPEATQALRDIGVFINKHIGKELTS